MSLDVQVEDALTAGVAQALERGTQALLRLQHPEGFWWTGLTSDSSLESDWLLLQLWMHPPQPGAAWNPPNPERIARAAQSILARQLPSGGFAIYPGGPAGISAGVKAYFALKLAGIDPDSEPMSRLRRTILGLGGVQSAGMGVKVNLALFGLYPRRYVPAIPPELLLLPGNVIGRMPAWTRAVFVPMSVLYSATIATGQTRPVPDGFDLREIVHPERPFDAPPSPSGLNWPGLFQSLNAFLKRREGRAPGPRRLRALEQAKRWIVRQLDQSGDPAGGAPALQYALMALEALGFPPDAPERAEAQRRFDRLLTDGDQGFFLQPCFTAVRDTALAAGVLAETGIAESGELQRASHWLLSKEIPSNVADAASVLLALRRAGSEPGAAARALRRLEAMQTADGGWSARDGAGHWRFLERAPFIADNAMADQPCPDVTGRVLEALCAWGAAPASPAVSRGVQYLLSSQEQRDGSWFGRWGVNYIYGTCHALRGLRAAGYDDHEAAVLRGGEWLRSIQNADGGWGESCASYDERAYVAAPSTASQTAWAVLGLIAGGDTASESVRNGIEYLLATQREDGAWLEDAATGAALPRVCYLKYQLYPRAFPVLALTEFMKTRTNLRGARE